MSAVLRPLPAFSGSGLSHKKADIMNRTKEAEIRAEVDALRLLGKDNLRVRWSKLYGKAPPPAFTKDLLGRMIAWRIQEDFYGGHDKATLKLLNGLARGEGSRLAGKPRLRPGTVLMREHGGVRHTVTVTPDGFVWRDKTYSSLSAVARAITGTPWNGYRFFGLRGRTEAGP